MVNPTTVNVGLIVPNTGADVDLWGQNDLNPDFVAIDGLLAGVQTISAASSPITLTSPAGFVPTPGSGPTQAQNRVLRFTGVLGANVAVTLPIPGFYIIENLTTGNFVLSFRGLTATEVIGTPQGETVEIYNDGANVRFVNLARMGAQEMWAGLTALPSWVTACTKRPYLLCDGATYNMVDYVALGNRLLAQFGGNGLTTFAVPDLQGRVPLSYDGTGTRITVAGCGIAGQTIGAAVDAQSVVLVTNQIPAHRHGVFLKDPGHTHPSGFGIAGLGYSSGGFGPPAIAGGANTGPNTTGITIGSVAGTANDNQTADAGGGLLHSNVQPSIVTGIWVVKT